MHATTAESRTARTACSNTSTREFRRWWSDGSGIVGRRSSVEADDGVEVDRSPLLVLAYLDHPGPDETEKPPVAHPHDCGQLTREVGPGPVPECGGHGV